MAGQLGLQELFNQVYAIAYGIWRKRWYMMMSAWIVCLVGWSLTITQPYRYMSQGSLYIDTKVLLELLDVPISNNRNQDLNQLKSILMDDKNINRIIERSELAGIIKTDAEKRRIVAEMKKNIVIRPTQDKYFIISYESDETRLNDEGRRKMAKHVVEQLMQSARNITPELGDQGTLSKKSFSEEQLAKAKQEFTAADQARSEFETEHFQVLNVSNPGTALDKTNSELKIAINEKNRLVAKIDFENSRLKRTDRYTYEPRTSLGSGGKSQMEILKDRLETQQKMLDDLVSKGLKQGHPYYVSVNKSIIGIQNDIKAEQTRIDALIAEVKKTNESTSEIEVVTNEVYDQIVYRIDGLKEELVLKEQTIKEKTAEIVQLREFISTGPVIRGKFNELKDAVRDAKREVDRWEDNLRDADDKLEATEATNATVAVVSDASNPDEPSGPDRLLFLSAALMGGLVVGTSVAFILSQIKPVVLSVEQLRDHFDLPILGNVTVVMDEKLRARNRRDMIYFGLAGGGLFVVFFVLIVLDTIALYR